MDMQAFADAPASNDSERYAAWFADRVRLYAPIHGEATAGTPAVGRIRRVVFALFQDFHHPDVLSGRGTHVPVFRAEVERVPRGGPTTSGGTRPGGSPSAAS